MVDVLLDFILIAIETISRSQILQKKRVRELSLYVELFRMNLTRVFELDLPFV